MNRPTFIADSSNKPLLRSPLFKGRIAGCLNGEPQADHHDESICARDKVLTELEKNPRLPGSEWAVLSLRPSALLAGAAQGFGQRAAGGRFLAWRRRCFRCAGIVARLDLRTIALAAGLVVETQRQRDALAGHLDLQHVHLDDVSGLHHLCCEGSTLLSICSGFEANLHRIIRRWAGRRSIQS